MGSMYLVILSLLFGTTRRTESNLGQFVTANDFVRHGNANSDLCLSEYVELKEEVNDILVCGTLAKMRNFLFFASVSSQPCRASNYTANRGHCGELNGSSVYEIKHSDLREVYDKSRTPAGIVNVSVFATITKIGNLDTISQRYDYTAYFRQRWIDTRLSWHPPDFDNITEISYIPAASIWIPDSFFSTSITVTSPDQEEYTVINSDGSVFYSRRIIVAATCDMNFLYYPFDTQVCYNDIESYGWTPDRVRYDLPPASSTFAPIDIDNNCDVCADHRTVGSYYVANPAATLIQKQYGPRTFFGVRWKFRFIRQRTTYIFTTFLPLWLICALSIGSCWIDAGSAPARVGMGITTVLVMINQMHSFRSDLPEVRYTTAMDAYFILCFVFVVLNVGEYGVINHFASRLTVKEQQIQSKMDTFKIVQNKPDTLLAETQDKTSETKPIKSDTTAGVCSDSDNQVVPELTGGEEPPTRLEVVKCAPLREELTITIPTDSSSSNECFTNIGGIPLTLKDGVFVTPKTYSYNVLDIPKKEVFTDPKSPAFPHKHRRKYQTREDIQNMSIAAQAYIKECFVTFDQDCSGTITAEEMVPMLQYMGVDPAYQAYLIRQLRRRHPDGRIDLEGFASLVTDFEILEVYGISALVFCGCGITRSTLRDMENIYRWIAPTIFVIINMVWFIIIGVNG